MPSEATILIVDDHPLLRRGLRDVIEHDSRYAIAGEASDGEEALKLIASLQPRIVILDIDMPRLNGLETIRAIRQRAMSVNVTRSELVLDTERNDPEQSADAMVAYLQKGGYLE